MPSWSPRDSCRGLANVSRRPESQTRADRPRHRACRTSSRTRGDCRGLACARATFQQFADTIEPVFWLLELAPQERVSFVSPAVERIWGRPAQDLYADPNLWMQAVQAEDRAGVEAAFGAWLAEPDRLSFEVEYRIRRPDGDTRWIHDRGRVVREGGGRVVRVTGVAEDIILRKVAERRARDSEREFRALVEGLPLLVWTCDAEGRCDYVRPQWSRFTGLPESLLLGAGWLGRLHPDDRAPVHGAARGAQPDGAHLRGRAGGAVYPAPRCARAHRIHLRRGPCRPALRRRRSRAGHRRHGRDVGHAPGRRRRCLARHRGLGARLDAVPCGLPHAAPAPGRHLDRSRFVPGARPRWFDVLARRGVRHHRAPGRRARTA